MTLLGHGKQLYKVSIEFKLVLKIKFKPALTRFRQLAVYQDKHAWLFLNMLPKLCLQEANKKLILWILHWNFKILKQSDLDSILGNPLRRRNWPIKSSTPCKCALRDMAYCSSASCRSFTRDLMVASFLSTILSNVWLRISKSFFSSLDLDSLMMLRHWWFSLFMLKRVALSSFVSLSYNENKLNFIRCIKIWILRQNLETDS